MLLMTAVSKTAQQAPESDQRTAECTVRKYREFRWKLLHLTPHCFRCQALSLKTIHLKYRLAGEKSQTPSSHGSVRGTACNPYP